MTSVTLDVTEFRVQFPAYSDVVKYPDATIEATFETAQIYIENTITNCMTEDKLKRALYLMTAHLLFISDNVQSGNQTGVVTGATIDKVSVTLLAPESKGEFNYWLNQSPYGQQLLALFRTCTVGGFYIGGLPETRALRKVGGIT